MNKAWVLIADSTKVPLLLFPLAAHFPVQDVSRDAQTHIIDFLSCYANFGRAYMPYEKAERGFPTGPWN